LPVRLIQRHAMLAHRADTERLEGGR
jgi:hypothetical protein